MAAPLAPPAQGSGLWSFSVGNGANEWFGPGNPLMPVAQDLALGRGWDFPTGYNIQTRPKPNEGVTFQELRSVADGYDLLRLVIETRKDPIEKLSWDLKKRGEKIAKKGAGPDKRIEKIKDFLAYPDLEHPLGTWLRMLSEDLFVLDAPTVYQRRTKGGGLYALELIDGRDRQSEAGVGRFALLCAEVELTQAVVDVVAVQRPRGPRKEVLLFECRERRAQESERRPAVCRPEGEVESRYAAREIIGRMCAARREPDLQAGQKIPQTPSGRQRRGHDAENGGT